MAQVGEPTQNGYAERLMRTIKEEQVDLSEYLDYHDAYQQLGRFLDEVYTHKRIHSALGYLTPAEFESQWWTQQRAVELTHFQQSVWCTEFWAQYTSSTSFIPALVTHFILFDVSVHVFDRSSYSHLNHEI
jgi:hypothetical protein